MKHFPTLALWLLSFAAGCAAVSAEEACDQAIDFECLPASERDTCILGERDNRQEAEEAGCLDEYEDWVCCVHDNLDAECIVTECTAETNIVNACLAG